MARMGAWGVLDSGSESEDEEEAPELVEDGAEMQVDGTVVVKGEWEDVTAEQYLGSTLEYDAGKLLDADNNGVMMAWETTIMQASVEALLPVPWEGAPRSVLNIGFGMGIVDTAFQARLRAGERHVIVEAHPDVLAKMRSDGWMDKPGFEVLEGRWQDVRAPHSSTTPYGSPS